MTTMRKSRNYQDDMPRRWEIRCPTCGHSGHVFMSKRQLQRATLACTQCPDRSKADSAASALAPLRNRYAD